MCAAPSVTADLGGGGGSSGSHSYKKALRCSPSRTFLRSSTPATADHTQTVWRADRHGSHHSLPARLTLLSSQRTVATCFAGLVNLAGNHRSQARERPGRAERASSNRRLIREGERKVHEKRRGSTGGPHRRASRFLECNLTTSSIPAPRAPLALLGADISSMAAASDHSTGTKVESSKCQHNGYSLENPLD